MFFIFSARERGRGSPRRQEKGAVGLSTENPGRGGLPGVAGGREGVC